MMKRFDTLYDAHVYIPYTYKFLTDVKFQESKFLTFPRFYFHKYLSQVFILIDGILICRTKISRRHCLL